MDDYGKRLTSALAAEFRAERARTQMTIADLVKATGLSKSAVLYYLNDQRDIPFRAAGDIAEALGTDLNVLLKRATDSLGE